MKEFNRPTMLMILDGYGINQDTYGNAIAAADKPHLDEIFTKYPGTTLKACGLDVGLPEGQMGNSEVGHLNIGAGRIVYQDLTMITKAIEDGSSKMAILSDIQGMEDFLGDMDFKVAGTAKAPPGVIFLMLFRLLPVLPRHLLH